MPAQTKPIPRRRASRTVDAFDQAVSDDGHVETIQIYRPVAEFQIDPVGTVDPVVMGLRVIADVLEQQLASMDVRPTRALSEESYDRGERARPTINTDHFRFQIGDTPVEVRIGDTAQ